MNIQVLKSKLIIGAAILGLLISTATAGEVNVITFHAPFKSEPVTKLLDLIDKTEEVVEVGETTLIHITSPGGQVYLLNMLAEEIEESPITTNTFIPKYAASCGAMLFLLGEERIMREGAMIMFHYPSINGVTARQMRLFLSGDLPKAEPIVFLRMLLGGMTNIDVIKAKIRGLDRAAEHLKNMARKKLPESVVNKIFRPGYDVWLTAREALAMGIATKVVP